MLIKVDNQFKTSLCEKIVELKQGWYSSGCLNSIRRSINPAIVKLKYKLRLKNRTPLKLHLGCGNNHLEGYVNIDWRKTKVTDLACDTRKLSYPDNSVELKEWYRVLVSGRRLIIECPDFDEAVREYIQGNEKRIDNIFGCYIYGL